MSPLLSRKAAQNASKRQRRTHTKPRVEMLEGRALLANLLANGDFELGNTAFSSQYPYAQQTGGYQVLRNPNLYWYAGFTSFGDHTTGSGLMMAVDGSTRAGTVVWQETVSVADATEYVFSGWTASMGHLGNHIDPSPARLRIFINDMQIGSDFAAPAPNAQWAQFSATWNSGTSTAATIKIVDVNTAGVGNDFTLDSLQFSAASVDIVAKSLTWNTTEGGVDLGYSIVGGTTTEKNTVALYWGKGEGFDDRLGSPIKEIDIPAGSQAKDYGPIHINGSDLRDAPDGTTHLLAIVDPASYCPKRMRTTTLNH